MIRNYRKKHITIIFTLLILVILQILGMLPINIPKTAEKIIFLVYAFGLGYLGLGDKTEKGDEMTRYNLSQANTVTMVCSLICIFAYSLLCFDDSDIVSLNYNVFVFSFCGLVILRSVIFLILDSKGSVPDDEG